MDFLINFSLPQKPCSYGRKMASLSLRQPIRKYMGRLFYVQDMLI